MGQARKAKETEHNAQRTPGPRRTKIRQTCDRLDVSAGSWRKQSSQPAATIGSADWPCKQVKSSQNADFAMEVREFFVALKKVEV